MGCGGMVLSQVEPSSMSPFVIPFLFGGTRVPSGGTWVPFDKCDRTRVPLGGLGAFRTALTGPVACVCVCVLAALVAVVVVAASSIIVT